MAVIFKTCITFHTSMALLLGFIGLGAQEYHDWRRINPGGGGAFSTIEAGPTGILLAGSDLSGVYMSFDHGASWEVRGSAHGLNETHVSALGFHPSSAHIFFVGTEFGIFRTVDSGSTFDKVSDMGYVTDIKAAKSDPDIVYASFQPEYNSLNGQVAQSIDGGIHWKVLQSDLPANLHILKLVVDFSDPETVYALAGNGRFACGPAVVYRSTNGAQNWSQIASEFGEILDVALAPEDPNHVYVATMNTNCDQMYYWSDLAGSLYESTDGGNHFQLVVHRTGVIWPKDNSTLRLIDPREPFPWNDAAGTWQSQDAGVSWSLDGISTWDLGYQESHLWSYGIGFNGIAKTLGIDLSDPDRIYWVNSQWAFGSADGGDTFMNLHTREKADGWWSSTGFDNVVMMDLAISPSDPNVIYAGYWDIGFWRSLDGGVSWQASNPASFTGGWEGFGGNAFTVAVDPEDPARVWTTNQGETEAPATLLRSMSFGKLGTWKSSNKGLPLSNVILGLSIDPNSPLGNRTMLLTCAGDVYRSTDDGASWSMVLAEGGLRWTAIDQLNANFAYAGGEHGFYYSHLGGESMSWQAAGIAEFEGNINDAPWAYAWEGVFNICPDPSQAGHVYLAAYGTDRGLYYSSDGGISWSHILADDHLRAVAIMPSNPNVIYTGSSSAFHSGGYEATSHGVQFSVDNGQHWKAANAGMAFPFALTLDIDGDSPPHIIVGSPGSGFQKGLAATSEIVSASALNLLQSLSIYPNPALDRIFWEDLYLLSQHTRISIYTSDGKVLLSGTTHERMFTIADLQPGIYFIKISDDDHVFVERFIKL